MLSKPYRSTFRERMDRMVVGLRNDILGGKWPVGAFLPFEIELGKQYQLSKNSVRKALAILSAEKLIEKIPSVGALICAITSDIKITIRLGYYASLMEQTNLNQILSEFHDLHPNLHVQTIPLPFDHYHESIMNCFQNGMLDAFTIKQNDFSILAKIAGALCSVSQ